MIEHGLRSPVKKKDMKTISGYIRTGKIVILAIFGNFLLSISIFSQNLSAQNFNFNDRTYLSALGEDPFDSSSNVFGFAGLLNPVVFSANKEVSFKPSGMELFKEGMIYADITEIRTGLHHLPLSDKVVVEERIEFEDWMLHPEDWSASENMIILESGIFNEPDLNFEGWMFDSNWDNTNYFDEDLQYESWMTKPLNWLSYAGN